MTDSLDFFRVNLTAQPFVFHSQLNGLEAGYLNRDLTALAPQITISSLPTESLPNQSPDGLYMGPYRDPDTEKDERVYLALCFITCQFSGARAQLLRAGEAVLSTPGLESTIVTVPVDYSYEGFTSYQLTITGIGRHGDVTSLSFESENYVLTMSIAK